MEAKLCILNSTGMSSCLRPAYELRSGQWKLIGRKTGVGRRTVVSVIEKAREEENFDGVASCETTTGTVGQKEGTTTTVYRDNWFDRLAIRHLSHSIQATTGIRNEKKGYDSLMESASVVARNFNSKGQQDLVIQSLQRAFPRQILQLIKILLPPSKFTREYFTIFTTIFFSWLVGPCEVKESEFEGRKEKNVVHIKKCRFLEGTSCVGMCTNMCKVPSQKFIKDSLGVPVNMVPNFEDMSCEMIFGQHPPAETDDPAFRQPCYQTLCKVKQTHSADCTSI